MYRVPLFFLLCLLTSCIRQRYEYPIVDPVNNANYSAKISFSGHPNPNYATSFTLSVKNKSKHTLNIDWDNSAIVKGKSSSRIVPDGTKLLKSNESKTDTIIPANSEVDTSFSSSDNVSWTGGRWVHSPIAEGTYNVYLSTRINGKEAPMVFKFKITVKKKEKKTYKKRR